MKKLITKMAIFKNALMASYNDANDNNNVEKILLSDEIPELDVDIPIIKNRLFMCKSNTVFAAMTLSVFGTPLIIIDEFFGMMPKSVQRFIVMHEVGHYVNGDLHEVDSKEKAKEEKKRRKKGESIYEIKADRFAASKIGSKEALNALKCMRDSCSKGVLCKKDIENRIKSMEKMVDRQN